MELTLQKPKIALAHDFLLRLGGAERVLLALREIFPQAEIFTLFYDAKKMGQYFRGAKINTSFLQKFPFSKKHYRLWLALMPAAVESFNLRDFDLVISSCSAFVKGLILRPQTIHICYCHSPVRFLWDYTHHYQSRLSLVRKLLFHYLRLWDKSSANRVDYFVANSKTTAQRIKKYYGQEAKVIYPGVGITETREDGRMPSGNVRKSQRDLFTRGLRSLSTRPNFCSAKIGAGGTMPARSTNVPEGTSPAFSSGYFLIVSQLTPYKRIDLAIETFNKLGLPLIIIGEGRDRKRLEKMAQQNIRFLGWQTDEVVRQYFQNCRAFIFPGEDDFGIAPVEAMGFGKPVLAYRKGGAIETVLEGITGEFFDEPAAESLADGLRRLIMNFNQYSPLLIKKRAEKFSPERFGKKISEFVEKIVSQEKDMLE